MKKDQPAGQPELASKCPKAYSAERRPFLATTRIVIMIANTPAKVTKMVTV